MKQPHHATVQLPSWQAFKTFVQDLSENWAFRGQANANWTLTNAIERTDFIDFYNGIEANFVHEFQRGARNYLSRDEIPEHLIEWLALMQHHGAPTRLLDLSRSPFISAYFAFEICIPRPDAAVAIWCFNVEHLKQKSLEILSNEFGPVLKEAQNLINEQIFEVLFYQNNKNLVFPVEPFRMNRRYSLQQSIFVSTGTSAAPFMEQLLFLGNDLPKTVVKAEIPATEKKTALRDLQKMNLHRASLFPDLDGYALSLKLRYNNMKAPDEVRKEEAQKRRNPDYPYLP